MEIYIPYMIDPLLRNIDSQDQKAHSLCCCFTITTLELGFSS